MTSPVQRILARFVIATSLLGCQAGRVDDAATADEASGASGATESGLDPSIPPDTDAPTGVDDDDGNEPKLDVEHETDTGIDPDGGGDDCESVRDTNFGCEFWAVDLPNVSTVMAGALDVVPHDQQFAIVVANASSQAAAEVSVYLGADAVETATVAADGLHVFKLPAQNIPPAQTSTVGVAYRVQSDVPITAYQFQPLDNTSPVYSNDATILFPTHVLTGNYTAVTGDATLVAVDGFSVSNANTGGFVSVVATENDTAVTLYPTQPLYPGMHQDVTLSRGQVLTAIASGQQHHGNLSGTRVEADKPVAVFSGSVATSEPTDAGACCADHVEHQMLPLEAWGSSYVAAPVPAAAEAGSHPTLFRVTGAYDGTQLSYEPAAPPGAPATIGAYETVAFQTDQAFTVRSAGPDQPFSVTQFLLSNQNFGLFLYPGDPSMIALPASDQFETDYVFLVPDGYASNHVIVTRPAGAAVRLNGAAIGAPFASAGQLEGVLYEYAQVAILPGRHIIDADEPVGISVLGYAQDVSFAYAGGSGIAAISDPPPPEG